MTLGTHTALHPFAGRTLFVASNPETEKQLIVVDQMDGLCLQNSCLNHTSVKVVGMPQLYYKLNDVFVHEAICVLYITNFIKIFNRDFNIYFSTQV